MMVWLRVSKLVTMRIVSGKYMISNPAVMCRLPLANMTWFGKRIIYQKMRKVGLK